MTYLAEPLNSSHIRKEFTCGHESLENYLKKQVSQDIKRKLTACFVVTNSEKNVVGYYTLSNDNIPRELLPEDFLKKMPRTYSYLPTTLLGRLAINKENQGQGLGQSLLIDALKRSFDFSAKIGSMAVIVDPIDDSARSFYKKFGFILLPDSERMFLPMNTVAKLF